MEHRSIDEHKGLKKGSSICLAGKAAEFLYIVVQGKMMHVSKQAVAVGPDSNTSKKKGKTRYDVHIFSINLASSACLSDAYVISLSLKR